MFHTVVRSIFTLALVGVVLYIASWVLAFVLAFVRWMLLALIGALGDAWADVRGTTRRDG